MQLTSLIAAAATAGAFSFPRQDNGRFTLTDFYFGGAPHSIQQSYLFDVTDGTYTAHCQTSSTVFPGLMPFGLRPCNDTCWSFSFTYTNRTQPQPGYILSVTQEITQGTNRTGCRFFGQDQIQLVQNQFNPNGNYWSLNAPQNLSLTYNEGPCIFN